MERYGYSLFNSVKSGRVEQLEHSGSYRLFFLLEGKVYLKAGAEGKYLIDGKEFILLPAGKAVSCSALKDSKYVIVPCTALWSNGNNTYMEGIEERSRWQSPGYTLSLPVRDRLEKVLYDFEYYAISENKYSLIYDTIFILLRLHYTDEEITGLFSPMFSRGEAG